MSRETRLVHWDYFSDRVASSQRHECQEMEQYGLTSAGWFQAPAPFKCGPKEKFPITGKFSCTQVSAVSIRFLLCI